MRKELKKMSRLELEGKLGVTSNKVGREYKNKDDYWMNPSLMSCWTGPRGRHSTDRRGRSSTKHLWVSINKGRFLTQLVGKRFLDLGG